MAKAISPELQAHLDSGSTTMALCWKVTRRDGTVQGFTEHDVNLEFGGVEYLASSGFRATSIEQKLGLSVDNLNMDSALSSATINEDDLAAGHYDDAEVELIWVNWADTDMRLILARGSIGRVKRAETSFSAEFRSLSHRLNQNTGRIYQRTCDTKLGSPACKVDLTDSRYRASGSVVAANGRELELSGITGFAEDWFSHGTLTIDTLDSLRPTADVVIEPNGGGMLPDAQTSQPAHFRCRVRFPDASLSIHTANGVLFEYTDTGSAGRNSLWVGWNGGEGFRVLVANSSGQLQGGGGGHNDITPSGAAQYRDGELHDVEWQVDMANSRVRIWVDGTLEWDRSNANRDPNGRWGNGSYGYLRSVPSSTHLFNQPGQSWRSPEGASALEIFVGYTGGSIYGLPAAVSRNAGSTFEIKSQDGSSVELWHKPPFPILAGDPFTIKAGCRKDWKTCRDKFSNLDNFQGFPDIPRTEILADYAVPNERRYTGGSLRRD